MTPIELRLAVSVLSKPLSDLYDLGKDKFSEKLSIWSNSKNLEKLSKKIALAEKVKPLWMTDKEVNLSSFYYPSKIRTNEDVVKNVKSLKDLPSIHNYVIQGTVGQGKSIFLRFLTIQELKSIGTGRIPIFIELKNVTNEKKLIDNIFEAFSKLGFEINESLFEFYASSGKIVLLLDAFDELPPETVNSAIGQIEYIAEKFPETQIIITSRPESDIQRSRHLRVIKLEPLSRDDHQPFLKKMTVDKHQLNSLMKAITEANSEISSLLTTPLLLTLLVVVYKSEKKIPNELSDFYEDLFNTLFFKHDKSKAGYNRKRFTTLNERSVLKLFEAFCFMTKKNNFSTSLETEQFYKAFEQAQKFGENCDPVGFKNEITKVACIMQEEGSRINFIHKSIQEYYSASFIKHSPDESARSFYTKMQSKSWNLWNQELTFLKEIDSYRFSKYLALPTMLEQIEYFTSLLKNDGLLIKELGKLDIGYTIQSKKIEVNHISNFGSLPISEKYNGHDGLISVASYIFAWSKKFDQVILELRDTNSESVNVQQPGGVEVSHGSISFELMLKTLPDLLVEVKSILMSVIAELDSVVLEKMAIIKNEEDKTLEFEGL